MKITKEYLLDNGFAPEDYNGKVFFRKDKYLLTYDDVFGWIPCNGDNYCCTVCIDSVEDLQRLMLEAK